MTMEEHEVECLRKERIEDEKSDLLEELAKLRPYLLKAADEDTAYDGDLWMRYQAHCRLAGLGRPVTPLFGHCGAVSWYVRLLYGGEVLRGQVLDTRVPLDGKGWGSFALGRGLGRGMTTRLSYDEARRHSHTHYWNRLGIYSDIDVDLTSDQFKGDGINTLVDKWWAYPAYVSQTIDAPGIVVRGPEVMRPGVNGLGRTKLPTYHGHINPRFKKFGERVTQAKYGYSLAQLIQNIESNNKEEN